MQTLHEEVETSCTECTLLANVVFVEGRVTHSELLSGTAGGGDME